MVLAAVLAVGSPAFAQARQAPADQPKVDVAGFMMMGLVNFTAADSFEVTVGSPLGSIFGAGVRVGLPLGGLYAGLGGWRYSHRGERVFVSGSEVFRLGIPLEVTVTPIELSAGWRFRFRRAPRFRPYVAGGFTSFRYEETSDFATASENVSERFKGFHMTGGADIQVERWIGVGLELNWTTVRDAIGRGGVSAAFDETNLGGTSFRFRITIGR
jgi:hypothetical protein